MDRHVESLVHDFPDIGAKLTGIEIQQANFSKHLLGCLCYWLNGLRNQSAHSCSNEYQRK